MQTGARPRLKYPLESSPELHMLSRIYPKYAKIETNKQQKVGNRSKWRNNIIDLLSIKKT